MKKLLLFFAVLLTAVKASAYDFEVDGIYYNILSEQDLTCEVTRKDFFNQNSYSGNVVIPSTVTYSGTTFSVTTIGDHAFYNCSSLTSVEIPNSVKTIGDGAFIQCDNLTSVEIPNSVKTIGGWVFQNCTSLTSVVIPNSVTSIGSAAFMFCSSLTSVEIPNSVTTIGGSAFQSCSGLTAVEIPKSVTTIESYLFDDCRSLTSVEIPNSVKTIEEGAFRRCSSLTSVVIPNSVTSIGSSAFSECSSLTSVVIPNSVTEIGWSAFVACESLESVVIGNSVTTIGDEAFFDCSGLKEITSLAVTPPRAGDDTFKNVSKRKTILKVPEESVEEYKSADVWYLFYNIVALDIEEGDETKEKCAAPVITIVDGKVVVESATAGATCNTTITSDDMLNYDGTEPIVLSGVYTIKSYAHAEGYAKSAPVTATLVWLLADDVETGVLSMEAKKAVLIRAASGRVIVSGTEQGETILLYAIDGRRLATVSANEGETTIPCNVAPGEVVIVKYGNKAVKIQL